MRRSPLLVLLALGLSLAAAAPGGAAPPPGQPTFTHGVASGDVTSSAAILWTRVDRAATIKVEVFDNAALQGKKAFERTVQVSGATDFTAKVDATGLAPGTTYHYQWRHGSLTSPAGTFRTAPDPSTPADLRFTYTGDADGFPSASSPGFNSFEALDRAREENGDFFAFLGDTIYSDSSLRPGGPATSLADYRDAYKVNRGYAALPDLLRSTSTYAQPDDHEVVNDYDGQTVDPARYAAGRRAFLEYLPVRESGLLQDSSCAGAPLFRTYRWGSEVEIFIPDERSCRSADVAPVCANDLAPTLPSFLRPGVGLPPAPPAGCLAAIFDPSRTLLGPVQKAAFKSALLNSTAKFKFVLSELAIQQFFALPYDRWEGYGAERKEIIDFIRTNGISNVVFLTTDNHMNLSNEVFVDRFGAITGNPTDVLPAAYELITGPIATNTLAVEIVAGFGAPALGAFNAALSIGPGPPFNLSFVPANAPADCRDLDTYSYGVVDVDASAGTATVQLKDDTGAAIVNQVPPAVPCSKTFGP